MTDSERSERKPKPTLFRCCECGIYHTPKPADWADQSLEIWRLGWRLVLSDDPKKSGYFLHCAKCTKKALDESKKAAA